MRPIRARRSACIAEQEAVVTAPHVITRAVPTLASDEPDASAPATSQSTVRERVFTGIQPSGASHLGNYLGAQVNYVRLQDEYDAIYGIVDMHALTTVHDGASCGG